MIIHNEYQQGSVDWMIARAGIPTASEFDQLVTPQFKIRTGQMPRTYLAKKVAEKWLGGPLPALNTFDMDQGNILEEEAIPFFELEHDTKIERVGFITTDDGKVGCSPDGILHGEQGIEIKCPAVHTHVGYLIENEIPSEYLPQVHGGMFVTGFTSWKLFSYRRHLPPLVWTVNIDYEIQAILGMALAAFTGQLERAYQRLVDINGGPPRRAPATRTVTFGEQIPIDVPIP